MITEERAATAACALCGEPLPVEAGRLAGGDAAPWREEHAVCGYHPLPPRMVLTPLPWAERGPGKRGRWDIPYEEWAAATPWERDAAQIHDVVSRTPLEPLPWADEIADCWRRAWERRPGQPVAEAAPEPQPEPEPEPAPQVRCARCGYDGTDRAYEAQEDGTWLCQGCPPEGSGICPSCDGGLPMACACQPPDEQATVALAVVAEPAPGDGAPEPTAA